MLAKLASHPAVKILGRVALFGAAVEGGRIVWGMGRKVVGSVSPEADAQLAGVERAAKTYLDPFDLLSTIPSLSGASVGGFDSAGEEVAKRDARRIRANVDKASLKAADAMTRYTTAGQADKARDVRRWAKLASLAAERSEGASSGAEALRLAGQAEALIRQAASPPRDAQSILARRDLDTKQKALVADLVDHLQRTAEPDYALLLARLEGGGYAAEETLLKVAGPCCSSCATGKGSCAAKSVFSAPKDAIQGVDDDDDDDDGSDDDADGLDDDEDDDDADAEDDDDDDDDDDDAGDDDDDD